MEGAEGYKIRYGITAMGEWLFKTTTNNSIVLKNLSPNTTYQWKIKTFCSIEDKVSSPWSGVQTFTTGALKMDGSSGQVFLEVYPNPVTSTATISFSLMEDSRVLIELYDITGQQLQTLLDAYVSAGSQNVNLNRAQLRAGIYFIKFSFNDEVMMRKVVIQ